MTMQHVSIFLGLGQMTIYPDSEQGMMGQVFAAAMTNVFSIGAIVGLCCFIWDKVTTAGK